MVFVLGLKDLHDYAVLPPYLVFRMAWNKGVNFGLLGSDSQMRALAADRSVCRISIGVFLWARKAADWRMHVAAGLLIGGALGNSVDRLRLALLPIS